MPDPTDPPAGGETPPAEPPVPPADPPADPPAGDEHDPARAKALIDKLREKEKDGRNAARERDELRARLDAIEAEKLTESERIAKEREEAVAERDALRAARRDDAVRLAVYSLRDEKGIADADLALVALDHTQITFDDNGQPQNVAEMVDALLEAKPILRGTPAKPKVPDTNGGGGGDTAPELNADEMEAARLSGMSPERYAAVRAAMDGRKAAPIAEVLSALSKKG